MTMVGCFVDVVVVVTASQCAGTWVVVSGRTAFVSLREQTGPSQIHYSRCRRICDAHGIYPKP
jgi:predicted metal-binding protein